MEKSIKSDLYRSIPSEYGFFTLVRGFRAPGFFYMLLVRKAAINKKYSICGIFYRLMHRHYSYKFGFQIPVSTKIGEGFYIGHFDNIVISPKTVIGKHCNMAHGVTVGAVMEGKRKGAPLIGDRVWMGTNSIIVGGISVGSDVMIAPGAFVNFDVPSHSIVIGNPGRIISKVNPTEGYIQNCLES